MPLSPLQPSSAARGRSARPRSALVAPLLLLASAICVTVLIGWGCGNAALTGFGSSALFMQPWTAVSTLALCATLFLAVQGQVRFARLLLSVPLSIALCVVLQESGLVTLPFDRILFPHDVLNQPRTVAGRPGAIVMVVTSLLCLSMLTITASQPAIRRITTGLCCLALALSLFSGALEPLGLSAYRAETGWALMSLPSAASLSTLAIALLAQRSHTAWPTSHYYLLNGRTMQWALALCVLVPVCTSVWEVWTFESRVLIGPSATLLQVGLQITVYSAVVGWVWVLLSQERTARWAFSSAFDAVPVALTDIDGRIIRWSKGCEELYGFTAKEARGRFKHELTGAGLPSSPAQSDEREIREQHKDGGFLFVLESRRLVQPQPDIAPCILLMMTDMTQRRRAEQAVEASQAHLNQAAELHEMGLFEWHRASDRVTLSPQAERLLGLQPGEFAGTIADWCALLRDRFLGEVTPPIDPSYSGNTRHSFRLHAKDRTENTSFASPAVIEGSVFFTDHPQDHAASLLAPSMLGIVMDATDRVKREELLKARESELRTILESVPAAVVTLDAGGRIRSFSSTAEALLGYSAEEITGCNVQQILPAYSVAQKVAQKILPNKVSAEKPVEAYRTQALSKSGDKLPVEISLAEQVIGQDKITVVFLRGLSEQIATQARLTELREQLLYASRVSALGEIGAGLAHELNQPLAATANYLGAVQIGIERQMPPSGTQELIKLASQEVTRAGEIIRRMRNFVQKGELDLRVLPLDELISDAMELTRPRARQAGVYLDYSPYLRPVTVLADPVQIQQVLVNLINNSLNILTTAPINEPQIIISTPLLDNGTILLRIEDNGPGFASAISTAPLQPFGKPSGDGLGFGLTICRRIVEGHGSTLVTGNAPHGGARVEFTLTTGTSSPDKGIAFQ